MLLSGCLTEAEPPGVVAPQAPVQQRITSAPVFRQGPYTILPVARFLLEARVLGAERYRFDRGAELVPVDLALGWGPMSDPAVLSNIDIAQGGRFYRWRVKIYPIPRRDIITHSANMHMIPANEAVRERLLAVRPGEVVQLEGYLVNVSADAGWHWRTSLRRNDSGDGACELVYVERIATRPAVPPGTF